MSTVTTAPPAASAPAPPARGTPIPFTRLARVEWRKTVDTRAARWLLLATVVLTAASMLVPLLNADDIDQNWSGYGEIAGYVGITTLPVVAILALTSEWNQRTALTTYALEPRRGRVLAAKAVAAGILAVLGMVVAAATTLIALLISQAAGREVDLAPSGAMVAAVVATMLLNVYLGVGFGALLHNSAAAIVAVFVVPSVVSVATFNWKHVQEWVDTATVFGWVQRGEWSGHGAQIVAAAALWIALPLAFGLFRTLRREVK